MPDDVERVLSNAMPDQIQPLASPLIVQPNETYMISFAGVAPGRYEFPAPVRWE